MYIKFIRLGNEEEAVVEEEDENGADTQENSGNNEASQPTTDGDNVEAADKATGPAEHADAEPTGSSQPMSNLAGGDTSAGSADLPLVEV